MKSKIAVFCLIAGLLLLPRIGPAQTPPPPPAPATAETVSFPSADQFPGEGVLSKWGGFKKTWIRRRAEFAKRREMDKGAVVFLGDSITEAWKSMARDFPDLKVANRGISGDITRGVWYRLDEDVLDLKPAAIVLLIGTNDLENNGKPDEIAHNVKGILARIHARYKKLPVIVCKVMPSSATKFRPADKIEQINALVDDVVKSEKHCIRCDTWSIFANDQGDAKKEEFPDLLHPNAAGYAKWADALRPIFAKLKLKTKND